MSKSGKKANKNEGNKPESFIWSDDEVELLLHVTIEYKAAKSIENIDWESCQSKYGDILDRFVNQYPTPENATAIQKDFPHKKEQILQGTLASKLKMIRKKYRQAVDSGRKSGHGRVVLLYFELCEDIWGGSPATKKIAEGIETTEIEELDAEDSLESTSESLEPGSAADSPYTGSDGDTIMSTENASTPSTSKPKDKTIKERRDLLDSKLKDYKGEKLKRKLPVDSHLLSISQEELEIKKKLLDRMEIMDKTYSSHMQKLSSNMERLTASISDGFDLLRNIMGPPSVAVQPPYMPPQASYMFPNTSQLNTPASTSNTGHFSYTQAMLSNEDNMF